MKAICTKLACFLLVLLVSGVAMAESITSPNGQLQLNFSVNAQGEPVYELSYKGKPAISLLEQIHEIMPTIEKETGVKIRFLVGIRRIPLTIIKDQKTSSNYLRENIDVMKAVAKSPYIVGSDFIGEEINDISELQPAITEIVRYIKEEDPNFTIRIHAG